MKLFAIPEIRSTYNLVTLTTDLNPGWIQVMNSGKLLQCHLFFLDFEVEFTIKSMKLRLRGNSLRFRLTQGEVSKLITEGRVSESVHFSSAQASIFTYSLQSVDDLDGIRARFANGEMCVAIPRSVLEPWANTDQIGIDLTQPIEQGKPLRILIEKDFRCLQSRSEEDESDNFPNPLEEPLEAKQA